MGDDAALKFLGRKFATETTPVVFLGVNGSPLNYFDGGVLPPNFSGMLERPLLKRSIVHLKEILPATKKVLILFDSDLTSQISKELNFESADQIRIPSGPKDEIVVDVKLLKDFDGWKKTVTGVKGEYDAVIVGLYQTLVDPKGHSVNPEEVITWTSENIGVPAFAFWDFAVGKTKSIGGLVLNGKLHGKEAADLALKRLNGEYKPGGKAVFVGEQGSFLFSKSQLKKWKIVLPLEIEKTAELVE